MIAQVDVICIEQGSKAIPRQATISIGIQSPKCRFHRLLPVVENCLVDHLPSYARNVGLEGALVRLVILLVSIIHHNSTITYCIPPQRFVFKYSSPWNPKRVPILVSLFIAFISLQAPYNASDSSCIVSAYQLLCKALFRKANHLRSRCSSLP